MGGCGLVSHPEYIYTCQTQHTWPHPNHTPDHTLCFTPSTRAAPAMNTIRVINVSATRPVGHGGEGEGKREGGREGGR